VSLPCLLDDLPPGDLILSFNLAQPDKFHPIPIPEPELAPDHPAFTKTPSHQAEIHRLTVMTFPNSTLSFSQE
jgi:hypothetical protein